MGPRRDTVAPPPTVTAPHVQNEWSPANMAANHAKMEADGLALMTANQAEMAAKHQVFVAQMAANYNPEAVVRRVLMLTNQADTEASYK
jgi:hypothetical protein